MALLNKVITYDNFQKKIRECPHLVDIAMKNNYNTECQVPSSSTSPGDLFKRHSAQDSPQTYWIRLCIKKKTLGDSYTY